MVEKQTAGKSSYRNAKPPGQNPVEEPKVQVPVASNVGNGHAVIAQEELPEWMQDYESEGRGISKKPQDNLTPWAVLLQSGRKELKEANTKHIPGAKAGMVWVSTLTENPLIDCRKGQWGNNTYNANGMLVQVAFARNWVVEWGVPRGSGYKGKHPLINDDAVATMKSLGATQRRDSQNPDKMVWGTDTREFVETREFILLLHVEEEDENGNWRPTGEVLPVAIAFDSQEHTFARGWNSQMDRRKLPNGKDADSWLGLWRLTTYYHSQGTFDYFKWRADWAGWVRDREHVKLGEHYYNAFLTGTKDVEIPTDDEGGSANTYATSRVNPDDMDVTM